MKKYLIPVAATAAAMTVLFSACSKEDILDTTRPNIIMTVSESDEVWLSLTGSGRAIIDWGGGTQEEITLSPESPYGSGSCIHYYDGSSDRTVTVTGHNITGFSCGHNQMTSLNTGNAPRLTSLFCGYNQLTDLDVSKNGVLKELYCNSNQLTGLDVSNNAALEILDCGDNRITNLDVGGNRALKSLICNANQLTSLNLKSNALLQYLTCNGNLLTGLDVSGCGGLYYVLCSDNYMDAAALDTLFGTLHSNDVYMEDNWYWNTVSRYTGTTPSGPYLADKHLSIAGNGPGRDGSGAAGCDPGIAGGKGWTVYTGLISI